MNLTISFGDKNGEFISGHPVGTGIYRTEEGIQVKITDSGKKLPYRLRLGQKKEELVFYKVC